jgi:hypothetical protein
VRGGVKPRPPPRFGLLDRDSKHLSAIRGELEFLRIINVMQMPDDHRGKLGGVVNNPDGWFVSK